MQSSNHLEQAKQDWRLPATSDEESFVVAVRDTKIQYSLEEDLKEVLRQIMVKVGLRANNWPDGEEKALLLSHIVTNYGGHTLKEILLAFEMGIQGRLDVEMNTYENFSCLYFSTVMNAYREWAKLTYKYKVKEVPQIEHKEDLSDKAMSEWLEDVKTKVKAGLHFSFLPVMVYDFLDKKGEMKMDNKTKFAYMDKSAGYLSSIGEVPTVEAVKNTAKRIILSDYILKGE